MISFKKYMIIAIAAMYTTFLGTQVFASFPSSMTTTLDRAIVSLIQTINTKQKGNPDAVLSILGNARDRYPAGEIYHSVIAYLYDGVETYYNLGSTTTTAAGCGRPAPATPPTSSYVGGMTRNYITVIGDNYDPETPMPLIFAFHGRTNSNAQVQGYYGIDRATQGNAIIVYPSALPENSSPRSRNIERDAALVDQIIADFSESYCIDHDRIFAMGHSLGAYMTNSLACVRADVLRAIGSVGGGTTVTECAGPIAAMIMHNPADRLASFDSGVVARDQLLRQSHCTEPTVAVGPSWGNCVQYTCDEGQPVIRCPHNDSTARNGSYYPHTWPDNAGQMIRDFFMNLP